MLNGQRSSSCYEVDAFQMGRITLAFTGRVADSEDITGGDIAFGRYGRGTLTAER